MEILVQFKTAPQRCPYIPSETASLEYRVVGDISEEAYAELLRRGWRRFGREFFRPACPHCAACRSIRIPVDRFLPSRSQRRALQCNTDIRTVVTRPTVTLDHLRLYRDYHADMSRCKGWPPAVVSATEYQGIFLEGDWSFAREFQYYDGERLIGVGLADVVPGAIECVLFPRPGLEAPFARRILDSPAVEIRPAARARLAIPWLLDRRVLFDVVQVAIQAPRDPYRIPRRRRRARVDGTTDVRVSVPFVPHENMLNNSHERGTPWNRSF